MFKLIKKVQNVILTFQFWLKFSLCGFFTCKKPMIELSFDTDLGSINLSGKLLKGDYDQGFQFLNIFKKNSDKYNDRTIELLREAHSFSWLYHLASNDDNKSRAFTRTLFTDWHKNYLPFNKITIDLNTTSLRLISLVLNSKFLVKSLKAEEKDLFDGLLIKTSWFLYVNYKLSERGMARLRTLIAIYFGFRTLNIKSFPINKIMCLISKEVNVLTKKGELLKIRNPDIILEAFTLISRVLKIVSEKDSKSKTFTFDLVLSLQKLAPVLRGLKLGNGKLIRANLGFGGFLGTYVDYELSKVRNAEIYKDQKLLGFERLSSSRTILIVDSAKKFTMISDSRSYRTSDLSFEITTGQRPIFVNNSEFNSFLGSSSLFFGFESNFNSLTFNLRGSYPRNISSFYKPKNDIITVEKRPNFYDQSLIVSKKYTDMRGLKHRRKFELAPSGKTIRCTDDIIHSKEFKSFFQQGKGLFRSSLLEVHLSFCLHPDVEIIKTKNSQKLFFKIKNNEVWTFRLSGGELDLKILDFIEPIQMTRVKSTQILVPLKLKQSEVQIRWSLVHESSSLKVTRDRKIVDDQLNVYM